MAPSMASYQTQTTLNVSQNHETPRNSSPTNPTGRVQVQESVDSVEDSVKDIPGACRGGAVRSPQPTQLDEEDELYSLSPQGKAALEKRESAKKLDASGVHLSEFTNVRGQPFANGVNNRDTVAMISRNAVDALLEEGATVHEPDTAKRRQAASRAGDQDLNSRIDALSLVLLLINA